MVKLTLGEAVKLKEMSVLRIFSKNTNGFSLTGDFAPQEKECGRKKLNFCFVSV